MGHTTLLDTETERHLRRQALELVQRLPVDGAHAERVLTYAHELLTTYVSGLGPSPCVTCDKLMLQTKCRPGLTLVPSSS